MGWSSFSEILIIEEYFDGSEQKITISNILSLSFGLIGLCLVVYGLIRDFISFGVCRFITYALLCLSYGLMAAPQEQGFMDHGTD